MHENGCQDVVTEQVLVHRLLFRESLKLSESDKTGDVICLVCKDMKDWLLNTETTERTTSRVGKLCNITSEHIHVLLFHYNK